MEEKTAEKVSKNSQTPIVGAIVLAGALIAGAILLRGTSTPVNPQAGTTVAISKQIGLNVKSFDACVASGKFKEKVQKDIDDGAQAGVTGTPYSFIIKDGKLFPFINDNGEVTDNIPGAQSYDLVMKNTKRILQGGAQSKDVKIRPVTSDDHIVGNINAKIVIVEYSDLDCPFCKSFHNTMHRVVKESNGDVAWVYRHYPITQLHPNAYQKAEATECAWEQGGNTAFWKYADKVFE